MKPASWPPAFTPMLWSALRGGYSAASLRADLIAGLTVAIVALPLAMALAIASGASPDKGLVTVVVGPAFFCFSYISSPCPFIELFIRPVAKVRSWCRCIVRRRGSGRGAA
jgi:hypothetical protein